MTQGTTRPARFCTQCGSPAGPDQGWCTRCGAQLTPAPAPVPAPVPEPATPAPRTAGRGRGWLIALVCVLVLATVFGAGAFLLFARPGSSGPSATDATPPRSHGTHRQASSAPTAPTPSPSAKPRPSYRCWSGRTARTPARCGRPSGERGLAWVFTGVDLSGCTPGSADRELLVSCDESLPDGTPVTLHLSAWSNLGSAIAHYDDRGRAQRQALAGDRYLWTSYDDRVTSEAGPWKAALMYRDAAYSMSLYAPSEQARQEAIREFGAMRPRDQLSGARAG